MSRPVTTLVVFFVCFNVWAGILMGTGVDSHLGLNTGVGGDSDRKNINTDVPSGGGIGETLFGLYNVLTRFIDEFFGFLAPGMDMIERAGVPPIYVNSVQNVFGILIVIDVVSFFKGSRL